jgi:hypothetical protein
MNGKIQMESKIGEGTTVILTIPLLAAGEAAQVLVESGCEVTPPVESTPPSLQSAADPDPKTSTPVAAKRAVVETSTQADPTVTKATTSEKQKFKVLVAEDNRVNQLLILRMFKHLGIEVCNLDCLQSVIKWAI